MSSILQALVVPLVSLAMGAGVGPQVAPPAPGLQMTPLVPGPCPDCTQWQLIYLQAFRARDGTIREWRVRASYALPAATDSVLALARTGRLPWSRRRLREGPPEGVVVPVALARPALPETLRMSREQITLFERAFPERLKRLRRIDSRLSLTEFRRREPLTLGFHPPGSAAPWVPNPLHPLKWKAGLLFRSPDGRFVFDIGADCEVNREGKLGGDVDGGMALYDAEGHDLLWSWTPGMYTRPGLAVWSGNETVLVFGQSTFFHPSEPDLEFSVPAFWILDLSAHRLTGWQGPPGPYFLFKDE